MSVPAHGSISDVELSALGLRREDVLDFSASINPLGPSPMALAAARAADWSRYLVEVGDGAATRAALLRRGMCVRDCASFGLPAYVRVGVRRMADCQRLAQAWASL